MRLPLIIALFAPLVITGLSACQKQVADNSRVLASINQQNITENELKHYLQVRQRSRDPSLDPSQETGAALDEMIDRALLTQHAESAGLDKDPEVQYSLRRLRENILVHAAVQHLLKEHPISDEELRARFNEELKATHPLEYRVRHILLKDEDDAVDVLEELKKTGNFAALAQRRSVDVRTGKNGGNLGWVNEGTFVPEVFRALTQMRAGDTSKTPIKSEFGWHIVKVEATRAVKLPSYDEFMANREAKDNFNRKLRDEKIEALLTTLREKAKITQHTP